MLVVKPMALEGRVWPRQKHERHGHGDGDAVVVVIVISSDGDMKRLREQEEQCLHGACVQVRACGYTPMSLQRNDP
jgi:hypothetical protein